MKAIFEITEAERNALNEVWNDDSNCRSGKKNPNCKDCPLHQYGCSLEEIANWILDFSNIPTAAFKAEQTSKTHISIKLTRGREIITPIANIRHVISREGEEGSIVRFYVGSDQFSTEKVSEIYARMG